MVLNSKNGLCTDSLPLTGHYKWKLAARGCSISEGTDWGEAKHKRAQVAPMQFETTDYF